MKGKTKIRIFVKGYQIAIVQVCNGAYRAGVEHTGGWGHGPCLLPCSNLLWEPRRLKLTLNN